jgi:hypothetical protein
VDAAHVATFQPQLAYPVVGAGGRMLGVVDLVQLRGARPTLRIDRLARGGSVDATEPLEEIAPRLAEGPVRVTDQGVTIGVITSELLDLHLRERLRQVVSS